MKNVIFALGCTGTYSAATSLPSTVSTLSTDVTPIKACMTNPSDSGNKKVYLIYLNQTKDIKYITFNTGCTGTYSAATTLPATLSSVSTDVTPIKACMTNPSDSGNQIKF